MRRSVEKSHFCYGCTACIILNFSHYNSSFGTSWQGTGVDYITTMIRLCTPHPVSFGWSNEEVWNGLGMWHVRVTGEVYTRVWWGDPMEGDYLESLRIDGTRILKYTCKKWEVEAWTVLCWVRVGTVGGSLWVLYKIWEFLDSLRTC